MMTFSEAFDSMIKTYKENMAAKIKALTAETAPAFGDSRLTYRGEGFGNPDSEGWVSYDDEPEGEYGGQRPASMSLLVDGYPVFEYDYTAYEDVDNEPSEREVYDAWVKSLKEAA